MRSALTLRSSPSSSGKRPTCGRAAPERACVQAALRAAPGGPVAGQPTIAMRSPCFRDARRAQHAAGSTCRLRVVRRLATLAPSQSCAFATQLANVAARRLAIESKIKGVGTNQSESIAKSTRHRGGANLIACRSRQKGPQTHRSQRHRAVEQSSRCHNCAPRRAFRPFRCLSCAFIIPNTAISPVFLQ